MTSRIEIILGLKNRYDYSEFIVACKEANVMQMPWPEYASKVVMLDYATTIRPNQEPLQAYLAAIAENGSTLEIPVATTTVTTTSSNCGSCGGGKAR